MSERNVTLAMSFIAELSAAKKEYEAFVRDVQSRRVVIPMSGSSAPGQPQAATTIGGMNAGMMPAGGLPMGSASPNWSMQFARMTSEMVSGITNALTTAMRAATGAVAQVAAASGGGAAPVGGGGGGGGGMYTRGLTRYAGVGFLLRTAFQGAEAYGAYNQSMILAGAGGAQSGGDIRAEYAAIMGARSGAPLGAGAISDVLTDFNGRYRATNELLLRGASATDAASGAIVEAAGFRRDLSNRADTASARPGYSRQRATIEYGYRSELRNIEAERNKELAPLREAHELNQRTIRNREFTGGSGPDASGIYEDEFEARKGSALAAGQTAYSSQVAGVDLKFQRSREDAERIRISQLRDTDIRKVYDLQMAGVHTQAAQLRAAGRYNEAAIYEKNQADYAAYQATDPQDVDLRRSMRRQAVAEQGELRESLGRRTNTTVGQNLALARNDPLSAALIGIQGQSIGDPEKLSEIIKTLAAARRSLVAQSFGYESSAAILGLQIARNPLGAELRGIEDQRKAALAALPTGTIFDLLGGSRVRAGINAEADAQARRREQLFGDTTDAIRLHQVTRGRQLDRLLDRDPYGAQAEGIVGAGKADAAALRNSGRPAQAAGALQLAGRELDLLRQNYGDSFRGTALDLRHFDTSNPRDTEDPGKVMKEIRDGQKEVLQAIKDLGNDS